MKRLCLLLAWLPAFAPADQGSAGDTGACSHVIGPVDTNGRRVGFTCENVGGGALLVWNASQLDATVTIDGGISAVNFYPGNFTVSGTFSSDGPLAFIGGAINVSGSIVGSSVLIVSASSSVDEIKSTLLGASRRQNVSTPTNANVQIEETGRVTATTRNITLAGNKVTNEGRLNAENGAVNMVVGTKLDIGWDDAVWQEGVKSTGGSELMVTNYGTVIARTVTVEAHRADFRRTSIRNEASGHIDGKDSITLITASPGQIRPDGTYVPRSFGVLNDGTLATSKLTLSPYYVGPSGGVPVDRSFDPSDAAERAQAQIAVGGNVTDTTQDNTPGKPNAAVIDSTRTDTLSSTAIVVPQLTASVSHMNATQTTALRNVAAACTTEVLRGEGKLADKPKAKPRAKAKPVLLRGAFFGTKISAVMKN